MGDDSAEEWRLADEEVRKNLPPGVKLVRTLRGHTNSLGRIAWSPDGKTLASPSWDDTITLWEPTSGKLLHTLKGHKSAVSCTAFDPSGSILASGAWDNTIKLWEPASGKLLHTLEGHKSSVNCVAFDPSGSILASGSKDRSIKLWEPASGKLFYQLEGHQSSVYWVAFDPSGSTLASTGEGSVIKIWDARKHREIRTLEGHTHSCVSCVDFSTDSRLLASKNTGDYTIRLWSSQIGACVGIIHEPIGGYWPPSLAFHPNLPILATVGSELGIAERVIHIFELDLNILLSQVSEPSSNYINAKVVLVGDTGVGKTGLSLVLNNQPYKETDSTAGRHVWTFDSREVQVGRNVMQTRETLLWDLAGQPGYRVIHQLHLKEVAVALVVFDSRSETDPLAGVRHWERALRLAQQRQGISSVPIKKFLVSARNDRGGVFISEDRLKAILKEFDFDGYFETSAKEGWNIKKLRAAIENAIAWENLPVVSSSQLFADIKSFLLDVKKTGRLLAPLSHLYEDFVCQRTDTVEITNLRDQFDTCIGRLENRDLIRRLSFGDYVLLQPELLDAYASAMVNAAKEEPDGLGSIAEEIALVGKFFVPKEQKVTDSGQEQLLLYATVEELVCHDLALRENANEGSYLVFPSQFNRDYEDAPEPKGKALAITFEGPVQSLYATLAVRLGHSGLFTARREEMWRNAAIFTAKPYGKCGIFLQEFAEARGRVILFFDERVSPETRFHFEEFVLAHAKRRSLDGTVELVRFFVCSNGHPVPDDYVKILLAQGEKEFRCPCGSIVSLVESKERIHSSSKVEAMEKSADWQRDFEAFVVSAKGETSTKSFHEWAGGEWVTLAIVFTDIVGSTELGEEIGDELMDDVRNAHFSQSMRLIHEFKGRVIKTIGDSFMVAFKSVDKALNYAMELKRNTGHPQIRIRAGIHIGPMHVVEEDVFGGTVNFAARVVGNVKGEEIWLSNRAKEDIDRLRAAKHKQLCWKRHDGVALKGFSGVFTLWSVSKADQSIDLSKRETEELEENCRAADQRSRFCQALSRLKSYVKDQKIVSPECFISYAWGNPDHELWVERSLATDLQKAGIKVILDRWENARIGASVPRFVERVGKTDRVIVVGTPLYRKKYENGKPMGGFVLAAEGDLIGNRMIGTEKEKESVLPILLKGTEKSSFPPLLHGRVYADFRKPEAYFDTALELLLSLYQIYPKHPVTIELRELLGGRKEL